jgi:hypothetical protein
MWWFNMKDMVLALTLGLDVSYVLFIFSLSSRAGHCTDYSCQPCNEEVSPVQVQIPDVSILYTYHTSIYEHIIQPLRH